MKTSSVIIGLLLSLSLCATEYVGSLQMANGYSLDNVRVNIDKQGNLTLYRVKFARMMPVRVDVLIPHLTRSNHHVKGDNIIPLVNGKQYPKRIVTNLHGSVDDKSLHVRCLLGGKEMQYKGTRK